MTDHADLIKRLKRAGMGPSATERMCSEAAAALEEAGEKELAADESLVELMTGNELKDATIARLTAEVEERQRQVVDQGKLIADMTRDGTCLFSGSDRGDCEHSVGLPGNSIPGQHDGPDTEDEYGRPNGWCWWCWKQYQVARLTAEVERLKHIITMQACPGTPAAGEEGTG